MDCKRSIRKYLLVALAFVSVSSGTCAGTFGLDSGKEEKNKKEQKKEETSEQLIQLLFTIIGVIYRLCGSLIFYHNFSSQQPPPNRHYLNRMPLHLNRLALVFRNNQHLLYIITTSKFAQPIHFSAAGVGIGKRVRNLYGNIMFP